MRRAGALVCWAVLVSVGSAGTGGDLPAAPGQDRLELAPVPFSTICSDASEPVDGVHLADCTLPSEPNRLIDGAVEAPRMETVHRERAENPWIVATDPGDDLVLHVYWWDRSYPCTALTNAEAHESDDDVRVSLTTGPPPDVDECLANQNLYHTTVKLDTPVGERTVTPTAP